MDAGDWMVLSTVCIIVGTLLVSSPLLGIVDLTPSSESIPADFGHGSAEVEVKSVPAEIILQEGAFGSGTYHVEGQTGKVSVGDVKGNPYLEYVIEIQALDFVDTKTYSLWKAERAELILRFRPFEIAPGAVSEKTYAGTVIIRLQSDHFRVLYEEPVDITVNE